MMLYRHFLNGKVVMAITIITGSSGLIGAERALLSTFFYCKEARVKNLVKYYALGHEKGLVSHRLSWGLLTPIIKIQNV